MTRPDVFALGGQQDDAELIKTTPPTTLREAAVKLSLLAADMDRRMEAYERDDDDDLATLRQVSEFVDERLFNAPNPDDEPCETGDAP